MKIDSQNIKYIYWNTVQIPALEINGIDVPLKALQDYPDDSDFINASYDGGWTYHFEVKVPDSDEYKPVEYVQD